jgi:hypothetical protein
MKSTIKSGFATTEFWVALVAALIPILNTSMGWELPMESVMALLAYILGRSGVKIAEQARKK